MSKTQWFQSTVTKQQRKSMTIMTIGNNAVNMYKARTKSEIDYNHCLVMDISSENRLKMCQK